MKKRLNNNDREALRLFARQRIKDTTDNAPLNEAYERAANLIAAKALEKWPAKDMAVLTKYSATRHDPCIYVSGDTAYSQFHFRPEDKRIPTRPNAGYSCQRTTFVLDEAEAGIVNTYALLLTDHEKVGKRRKDDFYALIQNARYYEDVLAVWPAAEALRDQICAGSTALSVMSDEVLARIANDPATQPQAA